MLRKRKGQSTLEYITVFVAIVAAVVILAYAKLKPAVETVYWGVANKVNDSGAQFSSANLGD